ncbi:MAG TPA: hypothetical protein VJM31_18965 [Vicinamibacterales bacterium]|nr:hypothetical protein [Vicinamibacterales bacterium]
MGLSCRHFLLDQDDNLYRLPTSAFERMLRDPGGHAMVRFAGRRIRMSEVTVELQNGQATRVLRVSCSVLAFDAKGLIDAHAFERHQLARAEAVMGKALMKTATATTVVDAEAHFAAQGGRWMPSPVLAHRIEQAALGRVKCRRL